MGVIEKTKRWNGSVWEVWDEPIWEKYSISVERLKDDLRQVIALVSENDECPPKWAELIKQIKADIEL